MEERERFIEALRTVVIQHTEQFIAGTDMTDNQWAKGYISALGNIETIITFAKMECAIRKVENTAKRIIAEEA